MKLFSVAIGEQYEKEALRLQRSVPLDVEVFTKSNNQYKQLHQDPLINGLAHKVNFANYIKKSRGPVIFMDADMFTLKEDPFKDFKVNKDTDVAYVIYEGTKMSFPNPDKDPRQKAFDFFGYKVNSGFMYFKNRKVAQKVCTAWLEEYKERIKLYEANTPNVTKYEYDEWALAIALMKMDLNIEILDKKWNDFRQASEYDMQTSESVFFQSHDFLDILD